jgi:SAM-dependent methyltransferase
MSDYLEVNRANWDERAPAHAASPDYAVASFAEDAGHLSKVVRFDRPRLGDLTGVRGVHLQCHIGTDTVSLARLGARMTGLDFSGASLEQARTVAEKAGADVDFVQSDVYAAVEVLGAGRFDLVYTGVGALCWLPSVTRWAEVVAGLLRPGGRLFIREGHPMMWAIDEERTDVLAVEYPYFERVESTDFDDAGTYVQTDHEFVHNRTREWSHGLGEIVDAVLRAGMVVTSLVEHDSVPWEALPGRMTLDERGEWHLTDRPWRLPLTYTLQAVRRPAG